VPGVGARLINRSRAPDRPSHSESEWQ
jgi:hypothetical protein